MLIPHPNKRSQIDLLTLHRWSAWWQRRGSFRIARLLWGLQVPLFGSSVPPTVLVGDGTRFGYRGVGIIIHADVIIGRNCLISHQVTIGGRGREGVPRLGAEVEIGAGAKILGPIAIGAGAKIGANAVVIHDVPPGAIAVGVPARLLDRRSGP